MIKSEDTGLAVQSSASGEAIAPTASIRGRKGGGLSKAAKAKERVSALSGVGIEAAIEDVRAVVAAGESVANDLKAGAVAHLSDVFEALPYEIQAEVFEGVANSDRGTFRSGLDAWTASLRNTSGAGEFLASDEA
jgi:hypothetical protein